MSSYSNSNSQSILSNVYNTETRNATQLFNDARNATATNVIPRVGFNQKILRGDSINSESIKEVKDQINRKKDACKDYEYMTGPEMLKLKKSCE